MPVAKSNIFPDFRPIGINGTVLLADSTVGEGVKWGYVCEDSISYNIHVQSATITPSSILCGSGFSNPVFTIDYFPTPSSVCIVSDVAGSQCPTGNFIYNYTWSGGDVFQENMPGSQNEFRIEPESQSCNQEPSSVYAVWMQHARWDSKPTGTINSVFISGLSNNYLTLTGNVVFTITVASGEYLWYAFRQNVGIPTFKFNNIMGGFQSATTGVSFTNRMGYTEQYQLWRSDYPSLGSVEIEVMY